MPTRSQDPLNALIARLGAVRRWLVALGVLRTATVWLLAVLVYVDCYALADRRFHFGRAERIAALAGLLALLAVLLHVLVRILRRDMSYTRAARYIEARHSFDQQLITAAEFYEKRADYPYSRRLARQLVLQVDERSRDFPFDATVNKKQGYALAGCVASCLILIAFFLYGNIPYFITSSPTPGDAPVAVAPVPPPAPAEVPPAASSPAAARPEASKPSLPQQFRLLSPAGDCLATNVASIPITFEVTDESGLAQAHLYCRMPDGSTLVLDSNSPQGGRQSRVSAVLELEQYDLDVGASVLFYAGAQGAGADANASSEIYLIEIRPTHQYWHTQQAGSSKPSNLPGLSPEDLVTILEYTRAIVKRTWALAQLPTEAQKQRDDYGKLRSDTEYCGKRLSGMRDDPDNRFTDTQKAGLTRIISPYDSTASALTMRDAPKAAASAQDAYRLLRQFIDELNVQWTPPESGKTEPQERPEQVKLQEQPRTPGQEQQRAERQLEEARSRIDSLVRQEKALKADVAKAMQENSVGATPVSPSQRPEEGQAAGDAVLRMLQARQNALRQQAAQLSAELAKLALPGSPDQASAKDAAGQRLDQAADSMKRLEDKLTESRYSAESPQKKQADAAALAESATRELAQAGRAVETALASGKPLTDAEKAEAMARQLAQDADAFDASLSPEEKQEMLNRLKAAEQLLERMTQPQTQTVSGGGGGAGGLAYTQSPSGSPGAAARLLSRQFWSVAIENRNRQLRNAESGPSDAHFFDTENKFFEDAAKFKPQQDRK